MINLFEKANKVKFEINPVVTEKEGFKVSSRLLKLAVIAEL